MVWEDGGGNSASYPIEFRFLPPAFISVLLITFHEGYAFALVIEGVRESEFHPAVVFAFPHVSYRATKTLITTDVHRRRVSQRDDESLVSEGRFSTEIFGPVNTTTFLECLSNGVRLLATSSILDCYRALCDHVEKRPRVIVPHARLAGCKA